MLQRIAVGVLALGWIVACCTAQAQDPSSVPSAQQTPAPQNEIPKLPETEVIGQSAAQAESGPTVRSPGEGGSILDGGIFSSPKADGYSSGSSTAGSLVDVPNLDLPSAVDVISEDLRRDQQAVQMDDLVRDIGGAVKVNDERRPDAFVLRGFTVESWDFRKDGFQDPTYTPRDMANVDTIEILKGPASVLYGGSQPGGTVNFITKNPQADPFQTVGAQFGSFGLQRYTVDSNGSVNDSGSLLYRVNAAYQNSDSFRDFGYDERTFVAPAMTWAIDSDTRITWKAEYVDDRRLYDTGIAAINGNISALPITRYLGEPGNDFQHFQDYRQELMITHRLDDDWSWNVGGYSLFYDTEESGTVPYEYLGPAYGPGTNVFLRERANLFPWEEQYQSLIGNLAGKIHGEYVDHNLVFGTEQGWFASNTFNATESFGYLIDATSPVYSNPATLPPAFAYNSTYLRTTNALYFQDLMDIGDHWKFLVGARYDHVETTFIRDLSIDPTELRTDTTYDAGTPRVGIVYEAIPKKLSYYALYSESFDPPDGGPYITLTSWKPETGQSWEGGIKYQPAEKLSITAAGFYITKQNVTELTGAFSAVQVAQQRSQGAEVEIRGQVTDRWSIIGSYAYTDTLINDPGQPDDGQRAIGVPLNSASLWNRYNVEQNEHQTIGFGLGVVYVGDREGDPTDPTFILPSYTRWDAGVFYKRGRLDASLYLENIFDTTYYTSSINQLEIYPGAPLNVRTQLSLTF